MPPPGLCRGDQNELAQGPEECFRRPAQLDPIAFLQVRTQLVNFKACPPKRPQDFARFETWQTSAQAAGRITRICSLTGSIAIRLSPGIGRPSFRKLCTYARIASRAMSRAFSRVSPSVTNPGKAGQVTTNPPSSAARIRPCIEPLPSVPVYAGTCLPPYCPLVRPSARMRLCRLVRSMPSARAAPETFQLDSSSARST
jgi:hypothetical protein